MTDAQAQTIITQVQAALYEHRERLPMIVVYDHPTDQPDYFVARVWLTLPAPAQATNLNILSPTLEPLQGLLAYLGLAKLDRSPDDEPHILESWI